MKKTAFLIATLSILVMTGCTDTSNAQRILIQSGYTHVGAPFMGNSQCHDTYSSKEAPLA